MDFFDPASPFTYGLELNETFPETSLRASLWKIVPNILTTYPRMTVAPLNCCITLNMVISRINRIGNQSGILYVVDRYKQIRENQVGASFFPQDSDDEKRFVNVRIFWNIFQNFCFLTDVIVVVVFSALVKPLADLLNLLRHIKWFTVQLPQCTLCLGKQLEVKKKGNFNIRGFPR